MKIFIFGAGASKGSITVKDETLRFPETKELFDPQYERYWREIYFTDADINRLKNDLGADEFELWLTNKWLRIKQTNNARQRDLLNREFIRLTLYFWNLFNSLSNMYREPNEYRKLIEGLKTQGVNFGFISFNYDTFLDRALMNVYSGLVLSNRTDYYRENLIKPHGSVNWFLRQRDHDRNAERPHDGDIQGRFNLICSQMYDGIMFNPSQFVEVGPAHSDMQSVPSLISERFGYQYFYPLLFAPMTAKMTHFVEGFYEECIDKAIAMISNAEEIYVIGYKARDDAIRKILVRAPSSIPLHVVSNNNATKLSNEILSWANNLRQGSMINGGFVAFNEYHFH